MYNSHGSRCYIQNSLAKLKSLLIFIMVLNCFVPGLNLPFHPYLLCSTPPKLLFFQALNMTQPQHTVGQSQGYGRLQVLSDLETSQHPMTLASQSLSSTITL